MNKRKNGSCFVDIFLLKDNLAGGFFEDDEEEEEEGDDDGNDPGQQQQQPEPFESEAERLAREENARITLAAMNDLVNALAGAADDRDEQFDLNLDEEMEVLIKYRRMMAGQGK